MRVWELGTKLVRNETNMRFHCQNLATVDYINFFTSCYKREEAARLSE